jgi:hypothetical protein
MDGSARRHEANRLEAFSDAVFGFALTLLVVSLEVPRDFAALGNLVRGFLPFALMFAMICWIWYEHQKFFQRFGFQDAWVVAVNCFLLFVVLFYVYPLKFLTVGLVGGPMGMDRRELPDMMGHGNEVMLLYSGGVIAIFLALWLLHLHAWRRRGTLDLSAADTVSLRYALAGHAATMALGLASLTIAAVGRWRGSEIAGMYAGILYGLMGPIHGINGYLHGRARARILLHHTHPAAPPVPHAKR